MDKSNKNLLSVIIPVYNAEKYIEDCLESIIKQTYKNLEIILVDDGSTDNSYKLCENYMLNDNRIKVFHKENGGVSSARNLGIDKASGEYITFVDIDDSLSTDMYEKMMSKIVLQDADICICDYIEYFSESHKKNSSKYNLKELNLEKESLIEMILKDKYSPAPWGKVFKKSLLKDCYFNENLSVGEDILFNLIVASKVKNPCFVSDSLYYYLQNSKSIMHSINSKLLHFLKVVECIPEELRNNLSVKYPKEFNYFSSQMLMRGIHSVSVAANKENKKQAIEFLKEYCTKENLNKIISCSLMPKFAKIECRIIKFFGIRFHLFLMPIYKFLRRIKRK